ncbi:MAG: hypothetical protein WCS20_14560 [Alphaproteobacteria bacterium]
MPTMALKSAFFDTMEGFLDPSPMTWANEHAFDALMDGDRFGAVKVLQLSSKLIRVSQVYWDHDTWPAQKVSYEMRLSGSGIGPVATLDALMTAIDTGLATGTLSKLEILCDKASVLTLTMDNAGYRLTSGDVVVALDGKLPLTFSQFGELAGLFEQVAHIDTLTRPERNALFNDLAAYSVAGLTLTDGGQVVFAVHVSETVASLTLNGLTVTAKGTFPDNLGEDVRVLYDLARAGASVSPFEAMAAAPFSLAVTGLTMRDASGNLLGSMANPLDDTPLVTKLDGRTYDDVWMGDNYWDNGWEPWGNQARLRMVVAGLGGDDDLFGGIKADHLLGGSGYDQLYGGRGADRLDGGTGGDLLSGGLGADEFRFDLGDGWDRITDFTAGEDVIRILAADSRAELTFVVKGDDVRIDYRSIHILVQDITVAELDQAVNFQF